jgi:hypothetical protein
MNKQYINGISAAIAKDISRVGQTLQELMYPENLYSLKLESVNKIEM